MAGDTSNKAALRVDGGVAQSDILLQMQWIVLGLKWLDQQTSRRRRRGVAAGQVRRLWSLEASPLTRRDGAPRGISPEARATNGNRRAAVEATRGRTGFTSWQPRRPHAPGHSRRRRERSRTDALARSVRTLRHLQRSW